MLSISSSSLANQEEKVMKCPTLTEISEMLSIPIEQMIALYVCGSRLFNIHTSESDYDFVLIVTNDTILPEVNHKEWEKMEEDEVLVGSLLKENKDLQITVPLVGNCISFRSDVMDVNIYKENRFKFELENCFDFSLTEIASLSQLQQEVIYDNSNYNKEYPICNILFQKYSYELPSLLTDQGRSNFRKPISAKSNNSFVKAKKKIIVEKELKIGLKSLFHSLRILHFGIQIAKHGKIINFEEATELYKDIVVKYMNLFNEGKITNEQIWYELNEKYGKEKKLLEKQIKELLPKIGTPKQKQPKK
ncbi:hypothetical protein ABK040_006565 [Willaertia magna]